MATTVYGNSPNVWWRTYMTYNVTSDSNNYYISATLGLNFLKKHGHTLGYDRSSYLSCNGTTQYFYPTGDITKSAGTNYAFGSKSWTIARGTTDKTVTLTAYINHNKGDAKGVSSKAVTIKIAKRPSYTVSYNANGGSGAPTSQTKWYGYELTLSGIRPTRQNYQFNNWIGSNGVTYAPSGKVASGVNQNLTLTAQWLYTNPPTYETGEITEPSGYDFIKNFSEVSIDVNNFTIVEGRTIKTATLSFGSTNIDVKSQFDGTDFTITVPTPDISGTFPVNLTVVDNTDAVATVYVGDITIANPSWQRSVGFDTLMPDTDPLGRSLMEVEFYNFAQSRWEVMPTNFEAKGESGNWWFDATFTENYVDDRFSENPDTQVRITYSHSDSTEKEYRKAFFDTTRNANFSTGLANTMFVSGCSSANFGSRVWWCYVNNPLYFPDTNYVEVGSNDTSVMGLCKVGDYLGVVKQSKTTDTAIFLLYPTSFDDDTTYAVKQGVQGVGALGKYSFNILGAETLFLSPEGVMAITPSEDTEHKVQNRSFFIDKKMLKEIGINDSYSFVFDGKYYIAMNNVCYVLDGNQRNSWGNDKTNLVYECYYLENIPASCFMKCDGRLWFSNTDCVCRFKSEEDEGLYIDAYDAETNEENVPVKARWSTILDDDGALHYYKTMQKKGNLVSILPQLSEYTKVYVRKDTDEPVEIQRAFSQHENIPNELYINKKFKKYKRLQFIIENNPRNEEGLAISESFGVDIIVKNYSLGNYSKK